MHEEALLQALPKHNESPQQDTSAQTFSNSQKLPKGSELISHEGSLMAVCSHMILLAPQLVNLSVRPSFLHLHLWRLHWLLAVLKKHEVQEENE